MSSLFERVKAGLIAVIGIGLAIWVAANLMVPPKGPGYCAEQFRMDYPDLASQSSITKRIWARTQGDHWLAALVVQPFNIDQKPSTIVCHFATTNFVYGHIDVYGGDRVEKLKEVSESNLLPSTWFK